MKLNFEDPFTNDQVAYQRSAIELVADIFHGQEIGRTESTVAHRNRGGVHSDAYDDPQSPATVETPGKSLDEFQRLERDTASLRARPLKQRQVTGRAELNFELRRLNARRTELLSTL